MLHAQQLRGRQKNWVPFVLGDDAVYVRQWLTKHVVWHVNVSSGDMVLVPAPPPSPTPPLPPPPPATDGAAREPRVATTSPLRRHLGAVPWASISGGTPAARLNATHFLGVGHVMTPVGPRHTRASYPRVYTLFAYTFAATPPFELSAATPQFRLPAPSAFARGAAQRPGSNALRGFDLMKGTVHVGPGQAGLDALLSLLAPTPKQRRKADVQFPMGFALHGATATLSWGEHDRFTALTTFETSWLVAQLRAID